MPAIYLTREELYARVWETPMTKLAAEFGISDRGLGKVCERNEIPRPPRGYWARLEAGHVMQKTPLGKRKNVGPRKISIIATAPIGTSRNPKNLNSEKVQNNLPEIQIPYGLHDLHPMIASWVKQHTKDKAKSDKELRDNDDDAAWWGPEPIGKLTDRDVYRFSVTSAFFRAVEAEGGSIKQASIKGEIEISISGQDISLKITEKMRQDIKRPTAEDRKWTAYPEHHNNGLFPSGFLRFTVATHSTKYGQPQWLETKSQKAPALIPKIIAQLKLFASARAEEKANWQRSEQLAEKRRLEEAKRKEEAERAYNESAKAQKSKADILKKIAEKTRQLHKYENQKQKEDTKHIKAMADAQNKLFAERKKHETVLSTMLSDTAKLNLSNATETSSSYDFFISHASQDKKLFVRELVEQLQEKGATVWYDELTLKVGDSLRENIDKGLSNSKFGIVVLSEYFFKKEWTQKELNGLTALEIQGITRILPIWHKVTKDEVAQYSPILADKLALNTSISSISEIADELMELLN